MIKPRVAISEKDVQAQRKVATTLNQTRVRVSKLSRHYDKVRKAAQSVVTPRHKKSS